MFIKIVARVVLMGSIFLSSLGFADECFRLLITPEQIHEKIQKIAAQIDEEYEKQELVILMVMKGAFCLTADLMRCLKTPCTIEVIRASSYGKGGEKRGELTISGLNELDLSGKHILVIDDIFDSGATLRGIKTAVTKQAPLSLKTLVLLTKKIKRESSELPDYSLFDIEDKFVVGYGLDYKEYFRNLPCIYALDLPTKGAISS